LIGKMIEFMVRLYESSIKNRCTYEFSSYNNGRLLRMTHMHITSWAVAIILLIVVAAMYGQGKMKPGKIVHMILRLFYLFILGTGIVLFIGYATHSASLFIKVILGIWTIVSMEMIAVGASKRKS